MKRHLLCTFVVVLAAYSVASAADEPTLKEARQRWLKGNYNEARAHYEKLAKNAKDAIPATIGLSRVLRSQGEYDKALDTIDALLKDKPKEADLQARRAELLYFRGRWEDAEKAAEAALAESKDHFLARYIRARVYLDRADLEKAES
jgi:tetratricopeptide (TPR) repeat protein